MGGRGAAAVIRVFAAPLPDRPERVTLDDSEGHHLRVRRATAGNTVEVLDGRGRIGTGRLAGGPGGWVVELDTVRLVPRPAPLVLLVGAGDRERMADLVEKAQELGVTELVPVLTERAASVAGRVRASHLSRLARRAAEALKQSGSAWLLALREPVPLDQALATVTAPVRWLADTGGEAPGAVEPNEGAAVVVGPEGGLTVSEREAVLAAGFRPVRLGPHVLRFDTAAVIAAAFLSVHREQP